MSGLRVYTNSQAANIDADIVPAKAIEVDPVFYSRRGSGPVYRWLYEKKREHWRPLRMHTSDLDSHKLLLAPWKTVPDSLQLELVKHYLD